MKAGPQRPSQKPASTDSFRCLLFRLNGNTHVMSSTFTPVNMHVYTHVSLNIHTHTDFHIYNANTHTHNIHPSSTHPDTHTSHKIHVHTYIFHQIHTNTQQYHQPTHWYTHTHRQTYLSSKIWFPGTGVYISDETPSPSSTMITPHLWVLFH